MRKKIIKNVINFLESRVFFRLILSVFLIQAAWLAISASYPMLFDEHYHLGLIDIYSSQYSPTISEQTTESGIVFGDLTRNVSYAYHYLLSFPYRVVGAVTGSFYAKVTVLRLINVIFVGFGLMLYQKLFKRLGFRSLIANTSLLLCTLIPAFMLLAAHINYDNLVFLIVPLYLLQSINILESQKKGLIKNVSAFLAIGVLGILVKFSFVPIFVAVSLGVLSGLIYKHKKALVIFLKESFKVTTLSMKLLAVMVFLVSFGLIFERYGLNIIRYKTPTPSCERVQPLEVCGQNHIWVRSQIFKDNQENNPRKTGNLAEYARDYWVPSSINSLLSASANVGASERLPKLIDWSTSYGAPTRVLIITMWVGFFSSIAFAFYSLRELRRLPHFSLIVFVCAVYLFSLFYLTNYLSYKKLGVAVAIQGRYLIYILPLVFVYALHAANISIRSKYFKFFALVVLLCAFTQGGGVTTYIVRSSDDWYWQRESITEVSSNLRGIFKPLIQEN